MLHSGQDRKLCPLSFFSLCAAASRYSESRLNGDPYEITSSLPLGERSRAGHARQRRSIATGGRQTFVRLRLSRPPGQ